MLKKMRYLLSKLLQDVYFKTIIPHVTFSISAWGSCPPATSFLISVGIEGLHLRAAKTIHSLPKNIMNCDLLQPRVHWQSLGCIYKRRLAIEIFEMFKVKHTLNRLSQHVKIVD